MAKSSRPTPPRDDKTDVALLLLAEMVLDDVFMDDALAEAYEQASSSKTPAGLVEPVLLDTLEMSDGGDISVSVMPGSSDINLTIEHARFSAAIVAKYVVETATLIEGRVLHFNGDRKQAAKYADKWVEEINTLPDDDDEDDEDFLDFMSGSPSPFEGEDDPGEPPPPSAEDKAMVERLAGKLARELRRKKPNMETLEDDLAELEDCPQSLWPILDGAIAARAAKVPDEALVEAWQFLLESQLTLIRYRIDHGWDWAERMVLAFQQKLIEVGKAQLVPAEDFAAIAGAMGEARIEVKPEMRTALADAGLLLPDTDEPPAQLQAMLRALMDQMAASSADPFDVAGAMAEATSVMPGELRSFMAHEFALSSHAVLRDSVPLMLLADDQAVRRAAANALEQIALPDTMSPEALRRMIVIRNWVPEADRPPIDQAIRKARVKGVACAQWPAAHDLAIHASGIDGSGSQSVVLTSRGSRKGIVAGVLLKLGVGVADTWCDTETARRDINQTLATVRGEAMAVEVGQAYLDAAVQNAIATGAATGRPPAATLLQIAELAGGADWHDRRLDIAAEAQRLFDALPEAHRSATAVKASLARSGEWHGQDFAQSWFLDNPEVRGIVKAGGRRKAEASVGRLVTEALPQRRAEWAERFLLLALRGQAATDPAAQAQAEDFVILAHVLSGDRSLADIPLMVAIARHTVEVAFLARW